MDTIDPKRIVFETEEIVIVNIADLLPRHKNWPYGANNVIKPWNGKPAVNGRHYKIANRRITKLYNHQTAGSITYEGFEAVLQTTKFMVRDPAWVKKVINDIEKWVWTGRGRGWPGCCYTFYIPWKPLFYKGKIVIFMCNELEIVSWHSSDNEESIAVVCQGYFKSRHMKSFRPKKGQDGNPNDTQVVALDNFIHKYAIEELGIPNTNIQGHADSPHPKLTCPGDTIESLYRRIQSGKEIELDKPEVLGLPSFTGFIELDTWELRQAALVYLGHDLGKYGSKKNGVDGDPGRLTRLAIEATEEMMGLKVDGYWDDTFNFFMQMYLLASATHRDDLEALI